MSFLFWICKREVLAQLRRIKTWRVDQATLPGLPEKASQSPSFVSGLRDFLATRCLDCRHHPTAEAPRISIQQMFECRSCALRCMRAIAGDALAARSSLQQRRLLLTPHLNQSAPRRAASTNARKQENSADAFGDTPGDAFDETGLSLQATPAGQSTSLQQPSSRQRGIQIENKKSLEIELRYLKDPLKLEQHIKYTLRCDKPDKALDLCRLASKSMDCVVSWNRVIEWLLNKNKINDALKVYNEMKKRAQFPDSHTYSHVLHGLCFRSHANQPVKEENVTKAIAIYTSMNAPNSRVKPATLHSNAALNVCAMALDMDALWSVAGQLPQKGPNAADHITYTIILNAIRHAAFGKNPKGMSLEQLAAKRQQAVDEGKRVWLEAITKWRAGEVVIDENLVCAMGGLLLISRRMQDWDNVLDLVQQTMNIKRLISPIDSPGRTTEHVPQEEFPEIPSPEHNGEDEEGYTASPAKHAFKDVKDHNMSNPKTRGAKDSVWATPGPQTLSLLVDASKNMRIPKIASEYWDLLTTEYSVKPDLLNFDRQLQLLALNRSSAKVAKLLKEDLPDVGIEPNTTTFRIAMRACQRDMKNPNVLEHATTVVDAMEKISPDPDPHTLSEYLSLALTTDNGPKIVAVINRMDSIMHNLRSRVNYGPDRSVSPQADLRVLKESIILTQTLIGTIDTLMRRHLVPREEFQHWHARRADLDAFVTLAKKRVARREKDANPPVGNPKLGKPVGLGMGKAAWALRKLRYNNPALKDKRRGNTREERDAYFNPPKDRHAGGAKGFGMDS